MTYKNLIDETQWVTTDPLEKQHVTMSKEREKKKKTISCLEGYGSSIGK